MEKTRVSEELLRKYLQGQCTQEELLQVEAFLKEESHVELLQQIMLKETSKLWQQDLATPTNVEPSLNDWLQKTHQRIEATEIAEYNPKNANGKIRSFSSSYTYAAVLIGALLLIAGSWYFTQKKGEQAELIVKQELVVPGSDKATLTLADGSVISLTDISKGQIAMEEGVEINYAENGEIVYSSNGNSINAKNAINTVATPRGGQFRITLPDGTKAWLNAASTLSYPLHFSAKERRVKMTGEVYFEVEKAFDKDKKRIPFIVESINQEVQVLGTKFNINSYPDEDKIRTSLVEGSVRVHGKNGESVLLKPGQLALNKQTIQVKQADLKSELAWTKGDFIFQGSQLSDVLRQIARWYDIEIDCPANLGNLQLDAMIARDRPLDKIIAIIQATYPEKLNFKLTGRRLTVTD